MTTPQAGKRALQFDYKSKKYIIVKIDDNKAKTPEADIRASCHPARDTVYFSSQTVKGRTVMLAYGQSETHGVTVMADAPQTYAGQNVSAYIAAGASVDSSDWH